MTEEVLKAKSGLEYITETLVETKRTKFGVLLTAIAHNDGRKGLVLKIMREKKSFSFEKGAESPAKISLGEDETQALLQFLADKAGLVIRGQGAYLKIADDKVGGILSEVQNKLSELTPDQILELLSTGGIVPTSILDIAMLRQRQAAVTEFEDHLTKDSWSEKEWQAFFERETWIFGHALDFRFLHILQREALVGGKTIANKDGQVIDFLMASGAENARFTALVDIKTPSALLLQANKYRNRTYAPGDDLSGGVAQLQSNCQTWITDGAQSPVTVKQLDRVGVLTAEPRGIVVAGHTKQLTDDDRKLAFELFRRNLKNPEIITFDELLSRAKYLTTSTAPTLEAPAPPTQVVPVVAMVTEEPE